MTKIKLNKKHIRAKKDNEIQKQAKIKADYENKMNDRFVSRRLVG